jgi:ATP-dependent protease ClpP protease subunit
VDLNLTDYSTGYLSFSAEITPEAAPSGRVMNGINIYNVLRGLPAKVVFHNVGNVDSIGNVLFLAGDERYACPHSTFMFHGVGFDPTPGVRVEQKTAQEMLDGQAWLELHHDELMADWELAVGGESPYKIAPL